MASRAMSKGERTRAVIIERAAPVFNTKGYYGTSMSELVQETGLEKGGIYGHFSGKEELAIASFEYAVGLQTALLEAALEGRDGAVERLFAVVDAMAGIFENPPVAGGCPILNTAIESDDANPVLRDRARVAMAGLLALFGSITKAGVASGELSSETDPRETASLMVGMLEGALMLARLYDDFEHMRRSVVHLKQHIISLKSTQDQRGGMR